VIFWSPLLAAAGRRSAPAPVAASEAEVAVDDVAGGLDAAWALHQAAAGMAQQGRDMGIFGPEVPVPAGAALLDRIVAVTGRDPGWTR
jgi:hypothetical protein